MTSSQKAPGQKSRPAVHVEKHLLGNNGQVSAVTAAALALSAKLKQEARRHHFQSFGVEGETDMDRFPPPTWALP